MNELLRRLKTRPLITVELLIASLVVNVLGLAGTLYTMQVLGRYVSYGVDATLMTLTGGLVIATVLEFGFRQVRLALAAALSAEPDAQAADAAYAILLKARPAALDRVTSGLRQEITRGAERIEQAFAGPNLVAMLDVPFALLYIVAIAFLSPALALAALLGILAALGAVLVVHRLVGGRQRQFTEVAATVQGLITAALDGAETARVFNGGRVLNRLWGDRRGRMRSLRRHLVRLEGISGSITSTATALLSGAIIGIGAILVVSGDLTVPALIGANLLAARAMATVSRLGHMAEALARGTQSLKLLHEFARLPLEADSGTALNDYQGRIEFKDVAFAHPGGTGPLFESLSLRLEPGKVLAVIGPNGAGKTTLARLLAGLIEPIRGQILVDGIDLRQVAPEWWRRQIVFQPQEPTFLPGTIADNIRIANPDIDDAGLNRVAQATGLRRFIDTSPRGLDTPIADGGRSLALGIRRRLGLARALATGGRLAILDEPTEGLDSEGFAAVVAVLAALTQRGATVVVISQNPTILRAAHMLLDLSAKPVPVLRAIAPPATQDPAHV